MERVVIVGGSIGGLRAAEQLRRCGWSGDLVVVGDEPHMPYNRPPLSKELLRAVAEPAEDADPIAHHPAVAFRLREAIGDVEWRLGEAAVGSDLARQEVELADGRKLSYDGLVIATGLRPRRLRLPGPELGRFAVRTLDDAVRLSSVLASGTRMVVVGGGFIGCEVAATARGLGCEVVVVEPMPVPMGLALGPGLGLAIQRHHERNGVEFRLGRAVTAVDPDAREDDRVGSVVLDDGSRIEASVVVESVGSHPNVEWLEGNGLDLSDGVLCDNWLRVEGRDEVVAVGDIARFPNPRYDDQPRRVEHWSMPAETAKRAASTLTRALDGAGLDSNAFAPLPTFWSDQFDLRIQAVGAPGLGPEVEVLEGALGEDGSGLERGLAVGYFGDGHLVGVVTVALPPTRAIHYRRELIDAVKVA